MESFGSELCLSCGLCCQGILHPWAELQEHERELASELGLSIGREEGVLVFYLPALCHIGGKCSQYQNRRPAICAAYQCRLLQRFLSAEISLLEALQAVQALKALIASMLQNNRDILDPSSALAPQLNRILRQQEEDIVFRRSHASLLMGIARFRLLLTRHFMTQTQDEYVKKSFQNIPL